MSDDTDKNLMTVRPPPGAEGSDVYSASTVAAQAPADLLDLVRDAEEAAKVGAGPGAKPSGTPTSATKFHAAPAAATVTESPREDVINVDDEAIDAPPSLPPMRAAAPRVGARPPPIEPPKAAPVAMDEEPPVSKAVRRADARAPSTDAPRTDAPRADAPRTNFSAPSPGARDASLPPAIAIPLVFALAIVALALATR